ncbi:MAG TPA: (d)CMP kinase [Gammaproteobacteria bacterium]|jgi:cytidylate kinase|nr:(d)CMP kinase [Gammaproteobacteria bacterium]
MSALPPVLAIDGPSGSGKGTVSRHAALQLSWHLLDSGALYRVLALAAGEAGVSSDAPVRLEAMARNLKVEFGRDLAAEEQVLLDGRDVSLAIRAEDCGERASKLAVIPEVRMGLRDLQRSFRRAPGLVADGRDMGTVIFPEAPLKVFLTASVGERAQRRYNQLKQKGLAANLDGLFHDISARDERDQTRSVSPLRPAADAVVLDTTGMGIEQVVGRVMELARERFGATPGAK